jgi:hypothetical protein
VLFVNHCLFLRLTLSASICICNTGIFYGNPWIPVHTGASDVLRYKLKDLTQNYICDLKFT